MLSVGGGLRGSQRGTQGEELLPGGGGLGDTLMGAQGRGCSTGGGGRGELVGALRGLLRKEASWGLKGAQWEQGGWVAVGAAGGAKSQVW